LVDFAVSTLATSEAIFLLGTMGALGATIAALGGLRNRRRLFIVIRHHFLFVMCFLWL
jgi:hypothetical protein